MSNREVTFDQVFAIWLNNEIYDNSLYAGAQRLLALAKGKGYNSIAEWRLATALRLGLDTKQWGLEIIANPAETLPRIVVGPYQGWTKFLDKKVGTTFEEAMNIPDFFSWCQTHDRIGALMEDFPVPTTLILLRLPDGRLIHVEGGHRICAVAYSQKLGKPMQFLDGSVRAAVANASGVELDMMKKFLERGTGRQ
jgi:hypothetical protein